MVSQRWQSVAAVILTFSVGVLSVEGASITIDGLSIPSEFDGGLVATQTIQTNHLDTYASTTVRGEGSELNALYVAPGIDDGFLRVGITGNLDNAPRNYPSHGVVLFLDTKPGGDRTLDRNSDGPWYVGDRFVTRLEGTRFDAGFEPDYAVVVNAVSPGGFDRRTFFVDIIDLQANANHYVGRGLVGTGIGELVAGDNPLEMEFAIDNRNQAGVAGELPGTADPNAATATSGLEMAIPTGYIGITSPRTIGVQALLVSTWSGRRHPEGVSNQSLPPFPIGTAEIDRDFVVDFDAIAGEQYATVTLVPEPVSLNTAVFAASTAVMARTRRRHPAVRRGESARSNNADEMAGNSRTADLRNRMASS